jgi:hypothetical protein
VPRRVPIEEREQRRRIDESHARGSSAR